MSYKAVPKPGNIRSIKVAPSVQIRSSVKQNIIKTQARSSVKMRPLPPKPKPIKRIAHPIVQQRTVITPPSKMHVPRRVSRPMIKSRIGDRDKYKTNLNDNPHGLAASLKKIGQGKILVMLANGPSLLEADVEKLKNNPKIDIMCINKPDMRVWPCTYWAFSDQSQYNRNTSLFDTFPNMIINSTAVKARRPNNQIVIRGIGGHGFSRDLSRGFYIGRSTVYASMQTALWMGYSHVYIYGIDMCKVNINGQELLHHYGVNPDVNPKVREERFKKEADNYDKLFNTLKETEKIFTMCSSYNPWSFVNKYGRLDHKTAHEKILAHASNL